MHADHTPVPQSETIVSDLSSDPEVSAAQHRVFQADGFIRMRNILNAETVGAFRPTVEEVVQNSRQSTVPMAQRTVYQKAFIQEMNLWQRIEAIRPLVMSTKLAQAAAELMGVDGVRLYHDQALTKEGYGGKTPWHCDQYYWPLDTDNTVTVWIPMQDVPIPMGPLAFAKQSHRVDLGRELEISEESDTHIRNHRGWRDLTVDCEPMNCGDVSYHSGWTFHGAEPNHTTDARVVFTIIYFADGTRLSMPTTKGQTVDRETWIPDTEVGTPAASWLNPLLWSRDGRHVNTVLAPVDGRVGATGIP
jgi:ectoine hydroxylase-related dioxygenase (phytanoyl-CoA dioxygenase family)